MRSKIAAAALVAAVLGGTSVAQANIFPPIHHPPIILYPTSGVVAGRILFYQHQGNYCSTSGGRSCTGARYLFSDYHTNMPVGDVKVYVREGSTVIGQGVTSWDGTFKISWYTGHATSKINFIWSAEQKDNRFAIRTGDGGQWVMWTNDTDATFSSDSAPQQLGEFTWGGPGSEHPMSNVYDGARRMWNDALSTVYVMQNRFTNLEVRATNTTCKTSCADGGQNRINLDPDAPYSPQGRIMHEMGHIANYKGSLNGAADTCRVYTFGDGKDEWNLDTAEWGCAGFEEALATFYADSALYGMNAVNPRTCVYPGECGSGFDLEAKPASCPTNANRLPINIDRFLWDMFDNVNDGEAINENLWVFFDLQGAFPDGTDNHQKSEWNSLLDDGSRDLDGHASFDWMYWYAQRNPGRTLFFPSINNCGWIGD